MFDLIMGGLADMLTLNNLIFMNIGMFAGIIFGAIPGLSANIGIMLMLPMTFAMSPSCGILMLMGVYCGGTYGGSITAILIGTPGTNVAVATVFDGYPLAKKGYPNKALTMALVASTIGGLVSAFALLFTAPLISEVALMFAPPEYFALAIFGLSIIAGISGESLLRGLVASVLGYMTAMVGIDSASGAVRFAFNNIYMLKGLLERERELIHANDFPCVTIYHSYGAWLNIDSALCDRKHGGYLAGRFLGQFAEHRLTFLAVEDEPESSELQCAGFRLGLAERGRELGDGSIMRCRLSFTAAYEYTMANRERFLSDKLAIHTHNDVTAIGMLTALRDLGVDIPGQVQLIGTDDIFLTTWTRPQLSTVHVQAGEIVAEASRLLRARIEGKKGPRRIFESKPRLILRQTTLPGDEV